MRIWSRGHGGISITKEKRGAVSTSKEEDIARKDSTCVGKGNLLLLPTFPHSIDKHLIRQFIFYDNILFIL
jgi:hypothetical protein